MRYCYSEDLIRRKRYDCGNLAGNVMCNVKLAF